MRDETMGLILLEKPCYYMFVSLLYIGAYIQS